MNLTSPAQVLNLLDQLHVRPSKSLGQNFLIDRNVRDRIVEAAELGARDGVLEVGPGLGVLTEALVRLAGRVVAVEKDRRLHAFLAAHFEAAPRLELVQADMLELDAEHLLSGGLNKLVSNLPYSVGTRILVDVMRAPSGPERIVATVQQEVAERLAARPGRPAYGLLSVWAQMDYAVEVRRRISAACFCPRPEVSSALVCLARKPARDGPASSRETLYEITRQAFSKRRKQMGAILAAVPGGPVASREAAREFCARLGLDPTARPENLDVADWCRLAQAWDAVRR
jgi:16S rRNA (adenine1518-N6/adenine1519-N6)-dimethyltransferase